MNRNGIHGFGLVELLVALSALAITAAIIVPKYLNTQNSAKWAAALNMEKDFNNSLEGWKQSGGTIGAIPRTSDLLDMFASNGQYQSNVGNASYKVQDSNTSKAIRMALGPDTQTTTNMGGVAHRGCLLNSQLYAVYNTNPNIPFVNLFGVVPLIDGKMRLYGGGTDGNPNDVVHNADGKTKGVVMLVAHKNISAWVKPTDIINIGNFGDMTVQNAIDRDNVRAISLSATQPSDNMAVIGYFVNVYTEPNGDTNISSSFGSSLATQTTVYNNALADLQANDGPVTIVK